MERTLWPALAAQLSHRLEDLTGKESLIMNKHERRRNQARHTKFFNDYVRHLPQVPVGTVELGTVYFSVMHHDSWCAIYDKPNGTALDCNCSPTVTLHAVPRGS